VERLGPDDADVAFQGTFSGPSAEARVRAFDDLRLSGEIVWLTWQSFRRRVVVKSFVVEYHSPWWIPYRVSCVVVHQSGSRTAGTSTISALISADLGNAMTAITGSTISLTSLQSALFNTSAMTAGTSNNRQAVVAVGVALAAINNQIALHSTLVTSPVGPAADPSGLSETLVSTVSSAGLLAAAVNAGSYVGRIGTNLSGSGN
jgi:hypothetical protein